MGCRVSQELWIPGQLPGMNEILAAAKSGHGRGNAYARMKAEWGDVVWALAKQARLTPVNAAAVSFDWREKDRRRDLDNIAAAAKFVLDGLVLSGALLGDGQTHVTALSHRFSVDRERPGVLVTLEPAGP
jgi:hypothetical protein